MSGPCCEDNNYFFKKFILDTVIIIKISMYVL